MSVAESRPLPVLLILGTLAGCKEAPPPPPPPPEVVVQPVDVRDTPVQAEFTGEIRGGEDVEVRARVAGYLQSQNYDEGTVVRKGQLLFVIDPKPFEATVARAQADMAEAKARHNRAEIQVNRLRPLVADNAVSQQDLDNAVASEEASRASVAAAAGAAHLGRARPGLHPGDQPHHRSGRQPPGGRRVVRREPGADGAHGGVLPRSRAVRFHHLRSRVPRLRAGHQGAGRQAQRRRARSSSWFSPTDRCTPRRAGSRSSDGGSMPETGTLPLQATFPNPGGLLRPGQFGRVRLPVTTRKDAIVIPQRAVQELQGTYNVFVVGSDSVAQIRAIKPGNRSGSDWVVSEGLEPADRIVVEGLQKVRDGVKVRPTAAKAPAPDSAAGA